MQDHIRFDKWWGRLVGVFVVVFMGWFLWRERHGFNPLFQMLTDGVKGIPDVLLSIVNYYGDVPSQSLIFSLLVGGLFGAVMTVLVYWRRHELIPAFSVSGRSIQWALIGGAIALAMGASLLNVILLVVGFALLSNFGFNPELRRLFTRDTLNALTTSQAQKNMLIGGGLGLVLGMLGSQVLTVPLQHCTYAPDADTTTQWAGYGITILGVIVVLVPFWTWTLQRGRKKFDGTSGYFKGRGLPYLLLAPTLISLLIFLYYPSFQIASQSLMRVRRGRNAEPVFDCLNNYIGLLENSVYQNSFLMTVTVTVAIVLISMTVALMIALLASQKVRGASIYRTLLIWPYALSPVVTAAIFISMFRDDRSGLINHLFHILGFDTVHWLTDVNVAPWVLVGAAVYNILGFNIVFYVAGLQNVPRDLLEAGQIDGANVFQRFMKITLPLLSPYTFFLLISNVTYSFYGIYGVVDTLFPGGGPLLADGQSRVANVLIYKVYEDSFRSGATQLGDVAAQSMILFVLVAGLTLFQFGYLENRVTYGGGE
jgi:sn-glycerol 3-phosphate transport system permease protein